MYDNALYFRKKAQNVYGEWLNQNGLFSGSFILATVHRNGNTDDKERLSSILNSFDRVAGKTGQIIVWPLHPRTRKMLQKFAGEDQNFRLPDPGKIKLMDPVGYLQMVLLEASCSLVLTDSGGVQKEAYFYEKPCVVLRAETEWTELVASGAAALADASEERIVQLADLMLKTGFSAPSGFYGDGRAAEFIAKKIAGNFRN